MKRDVEGIQKDLPQRAHTAISRSIRETQPYTIPRRQDIYHSLLGLSNQEVDRSMDNQIKPQPEGGLHYEGNFLWTSMDENKLWIVEHVVDETGLLHTIARRTEVE